MSVDAPELPEARDVDILFDLDDDLDKDNEVMEEKQVENNVPSEYTQTEDLQEYHEGSLTLGNFVEPTLDNQVAESENASIANQLIV